jgi:hypothetical protein
MNFVICELKLRNKYLNDVKKNKSKIKKIAKNFSQYSIIPVDIIHKVIKNYDSDYNHINTIIKNYEIKREILKMSIPLIKNQIYTYYHDDVDNEKYSSELFFKILERILRNFRFKITNNYHDYLGRYTLMVSRY